MDTFKSLIGGISEAVGGLWPASSVLSEPTDRANSDQGHENMDMSQEEQTEWWLVSPRSASNDSDMRQAEQFVKNMGASPQGQTEWWHVSQQSAASSREIGGECPYNNCLVLRLKKGSIAEEEADVLVSSVGCDLDLSQGMISKSMLTKAGNNMQIELIKTYRGRIREFEFAVSRAHGLSCKRVLHVACGSFEDEESKTQFVSMLYRCLQFASEKCMKSITFPPIGTGKLGYAPQMVAKLFHEATTKFVEAYPNQSLKIVTLAVFDSHAYQIFKSALGSLMPENMNISHHKQTEWSSVSQQPVGCDSGASAAEPFSENKDKPQQKRTEWWLLSHQSAKKSDEHPHTQCLLLQLKLGCVTEEQADVLVSSVGYDLDLSQGIISKFMPTKTGQAMQQELDESYQGGIHEFDFAVSGAHGLPCYQVLHVACGPFKDDESKMKFASVLCRCLQHASKNGMKTITFPPIGTGNLGYAPQVVAKLFHEAITTFLMNSSNQSLEVVTLAVFDLLTYQIFASTLDQLIQGDNLAVKDHKKAQLCKMASQSSTEKFTISEEYYASMDNDETTKSRVESPEGELQIKDDGRGDGREATGTECLSLTPDVNADDSVLEFVAPKDISEELVERHFNEITKTSVTCKKESSIIRVTLDNEKAFQQLVSTREKEIGTEYKLTRLMIHSGTFQPTTARRGGIADSCSFVLISLKVDSRVHITKYCLEELEKSLKDRRYSLHRTAVPGELVLEWRGPPSERDDQLVVRQIYKYANNFVTIVVAVPEPLTDDPLRAFLTDPSAELSCIEVGHHRKDQLYVITGTKQIMAPWRSWLRNVKTVHHSLLEPFTFIDDLQSNAIPRGLLVGGAADATPEMFEAFPDQITNKSKLTGSFASSSPGTRGLKSSDHTEARHQLAVNSSEPSSSDVAADRCSSVACSTSAFDDTLTQEVAKPEGFSSTNQLQPAVNSDSLLHLQEGDDQQKTQQNVQEELLPSREMLGYDSRSSFCDKRDSEQRTHQFLTIHGQSPQQNMTFSVEVSRTQTEEEWLAEQERNCTPRGRVYLWPNSTSASRMQGNEKSSYQCSDFFKDVNESWHAQTEEEWLAEQERIGTPRGRVRLSSNSSESMPTTGRQLEHELDNGETASCVKNQKLMPAKPDAVILKHTSSASSCDGSVFQFQQNRKIEIEGQAVIEPTSLASNPKDNQKQALLLEDIGHHRPQAINKTHDCEKCNLGVVERMKPKNQITNVPDGNDAELGYASEHLCTSKRGLDDAGASGNVSSQSRKSVKSFQGTQV